MSQLWMVRHGQAAFGTDDYDRLTETGRAQAIALGDHWLSHGLTWDEVWIGPRVRHRQTAELVADRYIAAGVPWPEVKTAAAFEEHAVDRAIKGHLDSLIDRDASLRPWASALDAATEPAERKRRYLLLLQESITRWSAGSITLPDGESFVSFSKRVRDGIERITQSGRGRRVAVFTSVGPITIAVQQAVNNPNADALRLGWRVRNGSATRFVFDDERFTLDQFNDTSHLNDDGLLTYL